MSEHDARPQFPGSAPARFPGGLPVARPASDAARPVPPTHPVIDDDMLSVLDPQPVPAPRPFPTAQQVPTGAPVAPPAAPTRGTPVFAPGAGTPGVQHSYDTHAPAQRVNLDDLLTHLVRADGSDLHLTAGSPPVIRRHNDLETIPGYDPLTPTVLQDCVYAILTDEQRARFEAKKSLDLAHVVPGLSRFRVNVYRQRGSVGTVIRAIPANIRSLAELNLPETLGSFADLPRGLVLVTGPTGSGKSASLAAIVDRANRTRHGKILTIEDPIEYEHQHRGCLIDQREVGEDTDSFEDALRDGMRQNPNIILVGEMRDPVTTAVALRAAETGHLVLATMHTQSAEETVTRVIDMFDGTQQQQIRTQLASTLQAVVCQTLVKKADGSGLTAAVEIMIANTGIRNIIRTDGLQMLQSELQQGAKDGMQTLNMHLSRLVLDGTITYETGLEVAANVKDFEDLTGGREGALAAAKDRARREQRQQTGFGSFTQ